VKVYYVADQVLVAPTADYSPKPMLRGLMILWLAWIACYAIAFRHRYLDPVFIALFVMVLLAIAMILIALEAQRRPKLTVLRATPNRFRWERADALLLECDRAEIVDLVAEDADFDPRNPLALVLKLQDGQRIVLGYARPDEAQMILKPLREKLALQTPP
jgi:hypothetical protein